MTERLFDRHKKRVREGALQYLEDKEILRDFIGPGGVKLNKEEQRELFQEALNDPQKMLAVLQNRQQFHKMPPDQVPWSFIRWIKRMEAMGAPQAEEGRSGHTRSAEQ